MNEISQVADPLTWSPVKARLMVDACRTMAAFHAKECPEIACVYARRGFRPDSIREEADLARIPSLGVAAMKYHLLLSRPEDQAVLKLTSSGTRGQKTQVFFDKDSLDRVQSMMEVLWRQEGLTSTSPTNYCMFSYDPRDAEDLGIAFTNKNLQRFAPVAESHYAIRKGPSGWEFRKEETVAVLQRFAAASRSVRLFGMPLFIWDLMDFLGNRTIPLPPGSLAVTGGGWKAAEDRKVSKESFRDRVSKIFGIPSENVRDNYGMAEHSAPYIECRQHRFHVPVYNRVLVRDPVSMALQPAGSPGLLELITPYNAMMPNLAVLSTDVGFIDPDPCPCGQTAPTFTLVGRAGLSRHKGCAITAGEIVRRAGGR